VPLTVIAQDIQMKKRREKSEEQVNEIRGVVGVAGTR
jgi:hypothetical protein